MLATEPSRKQRRPPPCSAAHAPDRPPHRRNASGLCQPTANCRPSRPSRSRATISRVGPTLAAARARLVLHMLERGARDLSDAALHMRASAARPSRRDRRPISRLAGGSTLDGSQNPPSRRLPSRPGADRQGRRLHPRFRGRAAPLAGRAAQQGAAGARRRRLPALDRLCGQRGLDRAPDLKPEDRAGADAALRDWGERSAAAYWECYRETLGDSRCGRPTRNRPSSCSISSCWKRRFTKSNTNSPTARPGRTFRWTRPCASSQRGVHRA